MNRPYLASLLIWSAVAWLLYLTLKTLTPFEMRIVHVVIFAAWSCTMLQFLSANTSWALTGLRTYAFLCGIAVICELIQYHSKSHEPEWKGLAASLFGVILGREYWRIRRKSLEMEYSLKALLE